MRTQCRYNGSMIGDTMHEEWTNPMHVERNNPIGTQCVYKDPILWCTMHACTEDQSYKKVHVHCRYTHLRVCTPVQSQMRALFHVQKNSYMGTQHETCTGSSCNKNTSMTKEEKESLVHKLKYNQWPV